MPSYIDCPDLVPTSTERMRKQRIAEIERNDQQLLPGASVTLYVTTYTRLHSS